MCVWSYWRFTVSLPSPYFSFMVLNWNHFKFIYILNMYECNDRYTLKRSQKFFITNVNTLTFDQFYFGSFIMFEKYKHSCMFFFERYWVLHTIPSNYMFDWKNFIHRQAGKKRRSLHEKNVFFPHEGTKYKCVTYAYLHLQVLRKLTKFNGSRNYSYWIEMQTRETIL